MKPSKSLTGGAILLALAAAYPYAMPMLDKWENGGRGPILTPYNDGFNYMTVCTGNTLVPMRPYTEEECRKIDEATYNDFGIAVLQCTPTIHDKPQTTAAAIVLAVNIGKQAYCGSTAAKRFNAGRFADGCAWFKPWNKVRRVIVFGLQRRRTDEFNLCMEGVRDAEENFSNPLL